MTDEQAKLVEAEWLRGDWYEKWQDATENADDGLMATLEALRGRVERTILAALAPAPDSDVEKAINDTLVKITEAAVMCLDADEDDTFRLEAFGRGIEGYLRALSQKEHK